MLTNNFYHLQAALATRMSVSGKVVNTSGATVNANAYNAEYYYTMLLPVSASVVFNHATDGVVIGSGDTPAAKTDYMLENIITSGITRSNGTYSTQFLADGFEHTKALILQNTSDAPITISEIGLVGHTFTQGSSSAQTPVLIDRTVLDTPVTIPAGESKTISYVIRINYPA